MITFVFDVLIQSMIYISLDYYLLPFYASSRHTFRYVLDSISHGVVSSLSWRAFLRMLHEDTTSNILDFSISSTNLLELLLSCLLSVCVDADHFITAKSFSLEAATNLNARPFAHSFFFIPVCMLASQFLFRSSRINLLFASAIFTHQARDALRRGFCFSPLSGNSPPLPFFLYLFLLLTWPIVTARLLVFSCPCKTRARTYDLV